MSVKRVLRASVGDSATVRAVPDGSEESLPVAIPDFSQVGLDDLPTANPSHAGVNPNLIA